MTPSSGRLSNYETRASAASHDSAKSSVGICIKGSFFVGERNLLEVGAVAVRTAQAGRGKRSKECSRCHQLAKHTGNRFAPVGSAARVITGTLTRHFLSPRE